MGRPTKARCANCGEKDDDYRLYSGWGRKCKTCQGSGLASLMADCNGKRFNAPSGMQVIVDYWEYCPACDGNGVHWLCDICKKEAK